MNTRTAPETWWSRLGVPSLTGNLRLVGAAAIDSLGTGLVLAFTIIYFARTTDVSLPVIGASMTIARLLALPTSVVVGPLIDRFTARRTAMWGNLVSAVGYLGFLIADSAPLIVAAVFVVQVGHTTYWTSSSGLVVLAAPEQRRTRWFGFMTALRNTAMGLGGALSAFMLHLGEQTGLHLIVVANAGSYLLAASLLHLWRPPAAPKPAAPTAPSSALDSVEPEPAAPKAGYGTVLRDRAYALLIGANATMVFAQMLIKVLLAIYIVEALDMAPWIAGTLIMVNTLQISLTQTLVTRRTEHHRPTRLIMAASLANAAAFGLFAALYAAPDWLTVVGLVVAMIVFTAGETLGFPALDTLSVSMAPDHLRGRYLATYQLSWTVGEVIAPALLTYLLARGAVLPMLLLLALSLVAIPLLAAMERRSRIKRVTTADGSVA